MAGEIAPSIAPEEEYVREIAVAAVDILGVRALTAKPDQGKSALNALGTFVRNASSRWMYTGPDLSSDREPMYALDVYFGDSVYLFANPKLNIETQVLRLIARVATLILVGLIGKNPFLARAGIAVGDMRRKVVQGEGDSREVRVGIAMVKAHQLEENQDWIGAVVDLAAPRNEEIRKWTLEYPVPLKTPTSAAQYPIALNWIASGKSLEAIEDILAKAVNETGQSEGAQRKLEHTIRFVRCVYDVQKYALIQWPEG